MRKKEEKRAFRNRSSECGATIAEASLAFPVFLVLLILGSGFVLEFYRYLAIEHLLSRSARQAILLNDLGAARIAAVKNLVRDNEGRYGLSIPAGDILVCLATDDACRDGIGVENAGGSEDFIAIGVNRAAPVFYGYAVNYRVEIIARNEPF